MSVESKPCDPSLISALLADELAAGERDALESHLEVCEQCRQRLAEESAEPQCWSDAAVFLQDEPFDLQPFSASSAADTNVATVDETRRVLQLLAPTDDPHMLGRIGGYEIAGVVGGGGMGVVLKGFDRSLNRNVAIKVLAPHLAGSGAARKRFSREAQAAAAVVHENVIEIHGVDEAGGLPYLAMPYIRGESLQKRLDDHGPLGVVEVLRIGMQTAAGLAAAHAQGLVHRDVKPANILLADNVERVKLTDFGLARAADDASLTRTGVIAGTPQFMSPEQARGESVDHRSDLFSLGSVLYTMCTARPPFRAETSYGILRRITDTEPRPIREINPEIPDWLVRLIAKLHAKEPGARYQSAEQVAELLEACLAHVQQPDSQPLPDELKPDQRNSFKKPSARIVKSSAVGAAVVAAVVVAVLILPKLLTDAGSDRLSNGHPINAQNGAPAVDVEPEDIEWDDGVSEMLQLLERDVEDLNWRAERLFDDGASAGQNESTLSTD